MHRVFRKLHGVGFRRRWVLVVIVALVIAGHGLLIASVRWVLEALRR